MSRTLIKHALQQSLTDTKITVKGWIRTRRDSKGGFSFLEVNDGSCLANLQIIADKKLPNYSSDVIRLYPGAAVAVSGMLVESPGKGQNRELQAETITVYGYCDPDTYPLPKGRISFTKLRQLAHLRPRTNSFGALTRIRNQLAKATHNFFQEQNFIYLHTPIITGSDCEGAGEMFRVTALDLKQHAGSNIDFKKDFFGRETFLTVSGQLEAEIYACALGNVYTFGPTFRAENSNTSRHLAEFWMIEPEMAFCNLEEDADTAEAYLKYIINTLLAQNSEDLELFNRYVDSRLLERLKKITNDSFQRLTYTRAVSLLQEKADTFKYPAAWGNDLQTEHERYLTEKYFQKPVIVTDYPRHIKAFYMKQNEDRKTVRAMDILFPQIGEIIGGSQREDDYDKLYHALQEKNLDPAGYDWYLDLRRFGTIPHSGFGLGFERLVQFCTGMQNIRDVIPFPRTPQNAAF